jgi:hypothetical protein
LYRTGLYIRTLYTSTAVGIVYTVVHLYRSSVWLRSVSVSTFWIPVVLGILVIISLALSAVVFVVVVVVRVLWFGSRSRFRSRIC